MLNTFPGIPTFEEWVPISEDEIFGEQGNYARVVRDDSGAVIKFEMWE